MIEAIVELVIDVFLTIMVDGTAGLTAEEKSRLRKFMIIFSIAAISLFLGTAVIAVYLMIVGNTLVALILSILCIFIFILWIMGLFRINRKLKKAVQPGEAQSEDKPLSR